MATNASAGPEEFLPHVHASIPWLAQRGFQLLQSRSVPAPSTDAFAEFQSADLSLRIVRDRELYSVDIGSHSDTETEIELYWLLRVIGADEDAEAYAKKGRKSLKLCGELLEKHLCAIRDRLDTQTLSITREQVKAIQRQSAKERFGFGAG